MSDSGDMFGDSPPWNDGPDGEDETNSAPTAAEMRAAGQTSLFGDDPVPAAPKPAPPAAEPEAAAQVSLFGDVPPVRAQPEPPTASLPEDTDSPEPDDFVAPASDPASPEPIAERPAVAPAPAPEPAPASEAEPVPAPQPAPAPLASAPGVVEPAPAPVAAVPVGTPIAAASSGQAQPSTAAAPSAPQPYRVLARKYRPQTFAELIGQEAMVQTLANAIKRDRLAHAFLMTGVRGVGKTSTARLIAKALNCVGPDGQGGPTIDPCGCCEPCVAIAEGRHIDVIEMDAASHTGVDDVREIIEAVRYSAVSARYKIYIIDEVHMLSRNAFNALLKTLEEPPAHVKFLFATTEVDKLPVTVLSRCQRFDLRRIPAPMLAGHFAHVCEKEGVEAEGEALAMVAAAAEGSVRDGLSILDQAIAHADLDGEGRVKADTVRDMLGLSDKSVQRKLLAAVLEGRGADLLSLVEHQFSLGVEPIAIVRGLMDLTHRIGVAQVGGEAADAHSAEEKAVLEGWAKGLRAGQIHRLWQLLLKGFDEIRMAPDPLVALQMALLRIMHAADLPDPGTLARKLEDMIAHAPQITMHSDGPGNGAGNGTGDRPETGNQAGGGGAGSFGTAAPIATAAMAPAMMTQRWEALVDDVEHAGQISLANTLRLQVRVVDLRPGLLRYVQPPAFREDIAGLIKTGLAEATGERWQVERVAEGDADSALPTLVEAAEATRSAEGEALRRSPLVEATMAAFPEAELIQDDRPAAIGGGQRNWRR